jgi:hypothetical protein
MTDEETRAVRKCIAGAKEGCKCSLTIRKTGVRAVAWPGKTIRWKLVAADNKTILDHGVCTYQ